MRKLFILPLVLFVGCISSAFSPTGDQPFIDPGDILQNPTIGATASFAPTPTVTSVARDAENLYRRYYMGSTARPERAAAWALPLPDGFRFDLWIDQYHFLLSGRDPEKFDVADDPSVDWRSWSYSGQFHVVFGLNSDLVKCFSASDMLRPYVTGRVDPRLQYVPEAKVGSNGTLVVDGLARLTRDCRVALEGSLPAPAPAPTPAPQPQGCNLLGGWHSDPIKESLCTPGKITPADGSGCCWVQSSPNWFDPTSVITIRCIDNPGCLLPDDGEPPAVEEPPVTDPPVVEEPPATDPQPSDCDEALDELEDLLSKLRKECLL